MNKVKMLFFVTVFSLGACVSQKATLNSCLEKAMLPEFLDRTAAMQSYLIEKEIIESWNYTNVQKLLNQLDDPKEIDRVFEIIHNSKKERVSLGELRAWSGCCPDGNQDATCGIIRNLFGDKPTANLQDLLHSIGKERFDENLIYRSNFFWILVYDMQYEKLFGTKD